MVACQIILEGIKLEKPKDLNYLYNKSGIVIRLNSITEVLAAKKALHKKVYKLSEITTMFWYGNLKIFNGQVFEVYDFAKTSQSVTERIEAIRDHELSNNAKFDQRLLSQQALTSSDLDNMVSENEFSTTTRGRVELERALNYLEENSRRESKEQAEESHLEGFNSEELKRLWRSK